MNVNLRFLDSTDRKIIAILCAVPLAMAAVNDNWLYTIAGWLDPWYNVAYFVHYNDRTFLNDYYKIARLSWIIPGYITYAIFSPLIANLILHLGTLILSTCALYLGLKRSLNSKAAFMAAAIMTVYFPFHGSGGWDYQTAPSGAYYLIAFALIAYAAQSPSRNLLLFLAGASLGAALHANILIVNLLPLIAAHFLTLVYARAKQPIDRRLVIFSAIVVMLGMVAITILMGAINYMIGRDFLFFSVLFKIVTSYVADAGHQKQWWLPWSSRWLTDPAMFSYLATPLVVFIVSAGTLIYATLRRRDICVVAASLVAQYIAAVVIWVFWQSIGQTALQPNYFAHPLILPMFCAIGGLTSLFQRSSQQSSLPLLMLLLIALLLAGPLSGNLRIFRMSERTDALLYLILFSTTGALLALLSPKFTTAALLLSALLFGLANYQISFATFQSIPSIRSNEPYAYNERCKDNRQIFKALISANQFFSQFVNNVASIHMWWDRQEELRDQANCSRQLSTIAASMTSFGSKYLAPPWDGMPAIATLPEASLKLDGESFIAIPTNNAALVDEMIARYKEAGTPLTLAGKTLIRARPSNFSLYLLAAQSTK
jgi:hypothetical protein